MITVKKSQLLPMLLIVRMTVVAFVSVVAIARAQDCQVTSGDADGDCISDELEQKLLDLYAPYIRTDVPRSGPESGVGVPSSLYRLIQHASINRYINDQIIFVYQPTSLSDAINFIANYRDPSGSRNGGADLSFRHRQSAYMWGYSDLPGGATDWPTAIARNDGVFGRVWRPWAGIGLGDVYSVQYFVYLTYNDTDFNNDEGSHEGDWLAIDIAVDSRANPQYPTILHMVLHNHGRQFFVEPRCMEFLEGHPVVYLENRVNEAWPNSGTGTSWGGGGNWPARDGFASNKNFDYEDSAFVDESSICRDHTGDGNHWKTWQNRIKNIGDNGISLCGEEGLFIQLYAGRYGDRSEGVFEEGDPPKGPPYQYKLWRRHWEVNRHGQVLGPWAGPGVSLIPNDSPDPFDFPLLLCSPPVGLPDPFRYSFCVWSSPGYSFALPPRPSPGRGLPFWALAGAPERVEGTRERPFSSLGSAVSRVPPGSEVYLLGSEPGFRGTVTKPVSLFSDGGPVTIGQ